MSESGTAASFAAEAIHFFCLKKYDELAEKGLPPRGPVTPLEDMTVTIPAYHSGGGMSFEELMVLARTTKVLKPKNNF